MKRQKVKVRRQTTFVFAGVVSLVLVAATAAPQTRGGGPAPMQAPADAKAFSPTLEDVP
jgi:hypothetical protein